MACATAEGSDDRAEAAVDVRTANELTSNSTQLAGTSEPEPSTRIAVLSEACDWRPTPTLPRWSLLMNQ